MTGIGPDIAEVINELATLVNVIKHDGSDTVQEHLDYEVKIQANSPFLTQYMLDCTLPYNTTAVPGDIIQFVDDSTYHLLVVLNPTRFENSIVTKEGILYKCNYSGDLKRKSTSRDSDYVETVTWPILESSEPVLLTGMVDYTEMKSEEYGKYSVDQFNLHISGDCNPRVGDRFTIGSNNWEIKGIAPDRLNNVSICRVSQDTRE